MPSFQIEDLSPKQVSQLKKLLACDEIRIQKGAGGGNSKVFCVEANGICFAVKFYPPYAQNQRDRLVTECMVYQFLNDHQVHTVPKVKASCVTERFLVMDWIEGRLPDRILSTDIFQALNFIRKVAELNTQDAAKTLPDAAEPFLSLDVLISQINNRLLRLNEVAEGEEALKSFLANKFSPLFERSKQNAYLGYHQHQINPKRALPDQYRSLIPADFGFHNTLRDDQGRLYFFDFDYFGWDDPTKLLADILWHPKMNLSYQEEQQFIDGISEIYHRDHLFLTRFRYTLPLFGLRWVLILLNEFIPAVWQNRQHAKVHANLIEAKQKQLNSAIKLLGLVDNLLGRSS